MILFTERLRAYKLFTKWAEKNRATKDALSVIAWLLPVINEEDFRKFIKEQERKLSDED